MQRVRQLSGVVGAANELGTDGIVALAPALAKLVSLTKLNLCSTLPGMGCGCPLC